MTGWIVTAAVVTVLAVLLLIPVRCEASYSQKKVRAAVKYLFVTVPLAPRPESGKKSKKTQQTDQKESGQGQKKKPSALMNMIKKDGLGGIVDFISHLSRSGKRLLEKVLRHLKVKDFRLVIIVKGDDAADTALRYGKICAVFYPMFSYLCGLARVTVKELSVLPGFHAEQSKEEFSFTARISPVFLIGAGLGFFLRFFAHTIAKQFRKQKPPVQNQTKAVH
ncbi:MAG: DUF2953 domain-containing protein [Clostridiales bacterium]|nr:DUF2953 domain-containing protein [Clostridiales bacterium]